MHSMPNFAVLEGESRHAESSAKQQQAAMFVSDILEKTCSFNSFSASVSTLNHHIFTYFVQRRSFLSSSYHLNLKKAFKVKNLVPMTMHHGRCHCRVACSLSSLSAHAHAKRPLLWTDTKHNHGIFNLNCRTLIFTLEVHRTLKTILLLNYDLSSFLRQMLGWSALHLVLFYLIVATYHRYLLSNSKGASICLDNGKITKLPTWQNRTKNPVCM